MIVGFKRKEEEKIFAGIRVKGWSHSIQVRAKDKMDEIHNALRLEDLRVPPSNHLEKLKGDREGAYNIRINRQWRICFYFEKGHAYDVEIVDYH